MSNVALSGSYSFKDNKFTDKKVSEKYTFALFDDEGAAKGVFLPGDEAVAITYKDENGKIITLTQIGGDGVDGKTDIRLAAGYRFDITITAIKWRLSLPANDPDRSDLKGKGRRMLAGDVSPFFLLTGSTSGITYPVSEP